MPTSSRSSSSTSTASVYTTSSKMSSTTAYDTQASSIAALPSFAHSLSALPRMTSVTSDMVHYGTLSRTKQASEAKLHTVLQTARQRTSGTPYLSMPSPLDDSAEDDGSALTISRRKAKTTVRI
ncbi:hypothetical protein BC835DRAFT_1413249 [Cytidiella melzeri]|nr:hypothetical protein BC835DRAFT_1413249 [Cytidiella melzeri]